MTSKDVLILGGLALAAWYVFGRQGAMGSAYGAYGAPAGGLPYGVPVGYPGATYPYYAAGAYPVTYRPQSIYDVIGNQISAGLQNAFQGEGYGQPAFTHYPVPV